MPKANKVVAFGCVHAPLHDPAAVEWVTEKVSKEKPDWVVLLGDGIESNAASQWPDAKELGIPLEDEYNALDRVLAGIRKAAPRARRKYLAGNHETNILQEGRIDPRIRSLVDWKNHKNVPELSHWSVGGDYNYSRSLGSFWLGPMCFAHGWETTPSQAPTEAMYFTKTWPNSVYICAHTHRPTPVTQVEFKGDLMLPHHYANVGCLRELNPGYMKRKRKWAWGHGAFVGEFMPLKSPRQSREWDGRVDVLKMYDD